MTRPFFFGYGSLVNAATHSFPEAAPATLRGWRRAWKHTDLRPVAFLTAVPADEGDEIDGLIAHVPGDDWDALDAREHAYGRERVTERVRHALAEPVEVQVYAIPQGRHGAPDVKHPVLLSYVDVVVQGYLRVFGPGGVERFFASTDGWDAPILNDRAAPRYPRHQVLTAEEREMVDAHLARSGARVLAAGG